MGVTTQESKTGIPSPSHSIILDQSGVQMTHTGDTDETEVDSFTIPGGTMGINDGLMITSIWDGDDSANNIIYRIRLGGISGSVIQQITVTTAAACASQRYVLNRGATNSQVGIPQFGTDYALSTAFFTSAVDMTADQDITFSVALANSGETGGIEAYTIELLRFEG